MITLWQGTVGLLGQEAHYEELFLVFLTVKSALRTTRYNLSPVLEATIASQQDGCLR